MAQRRFLAPYGWKITIYHLCTYDLYGPVRNAFDTLHGQMGGGWALEMESFLSPMKWYQADRRVPFGAQKHYAQGRINHRCHCIGCYKYKSPPWRGLRVQTSISAYTYVSQR